MKKFNRVFTVLIFIFLYVPMAVLIVASFDTGKSLAGFEGFTMQQYVRLFKDRTLLKLLGNSILLSVLAWLIFGEYMNIWMFIGIALTVVGVVIVNRSDVGSKAKAAA